MGIRLNTTVQSLFAQRQVSRANQRAAQGLQQLAAGLRITRASVDAAGLAIAERFRSSVRQLNQEVSNFQSGINASRTAEGALSAQSGAVGRLRELAVQASNGTLTDEQRASLNAEAQQLIQEIDQTGQRTEFNDVSLLDGSTGVIALDAQGTVELELGESTAASLGIDNLDISTAAGATAALNSLDNAAQQINENRARLGAQENRLTAAIEQRSRQALDETEAESRIRDLDVARAVTDQTRNRVLQQAGLAALAQGNLQGETALRLLGG